MEINQFLEEAKKRSWLKIIDKPLDVNLEIPHVAYIETKKEDSKILLFKNPVDKKEGIKYDIPVLMNTFANYEITEFIFGKHPDKIAKEIEELLHIKPPESFKEKINSLKTVFKLKNIFPKKLKKEGRCQQIKYTENINLDIIPILKTWEKDAGKFITAGHIYTQSIDGKIKNLGLYRIQKLNKDKLIIHWQIHKDGNHFFQEYKKAGKKMPVSIAIGGDPLYFWCGQAPLPYGIFELLLYGFIRNKNPKLVKSITNDIYIPEDVDIVIEGEVDPNNFAPEGPFGDHTGYYTPVEKFPVMEVKAITMKKNPIYQATVVGKPPVEDKYMGWATERIFLPLLKTTTPDLIDYHMPENGCFHNLLIAKISPRYKGHSKQIMHALWGVGQMSFLKHAIFVDENAPDLTDYENLARYILNRLSNKSFLITEGIVDQLDHASYESLVGGKLGIDATGKEIKKEIEILDDKALLEKLQKLDKDIKEIKQYFTDTSNPILLVKIQKTKPVKEIFNKLKQLKKHLKIVIFLDDKKENDLNNPYMLVWRITGDIDALYDVWIEEIWGVNATSKNDIDGYYRKWPEEIKCNKEVLNSLKEKGIIDIDENFLKKYQI
ncbi:4-hydroxy-3-polyprenylbenzoate decarboxylase [Hydrogenothermus marinus]|uniref:4-hydroxy-3-polyprenylbenzoate decarboxylase n=1 Tax=Hydrogenothermus marinus TaxID=133270 RepID=A0A3M0BTN8_9AQUI|nr:menaquinone biosynthesis decarboxylase [Hydrogenothermus marinus]RMA97915.1 4-hydroxy-3-polyprenylbenzoate decarboxylase [Hydrogenothermus marinus]